VAPNAADVSARSLTQITAADLAGTFLNAVLLDALEGDLERMERINRSVALLSEADRAAHPDKLRVIPVLSIQPSIDLGTLAFEEFEHLSATLRYMLRGLGASHEKGWDLLSYLAFESAYTRRLLDLGLADVRTRTSEIEAFLERGRKTPPNE
jgi:NTE family protein